VDRRCHRDVGVLEPLARKVVRAFVDLDGIGDRPQQVVAGHAKMSDVLLLAAARVPKGRPVFEVKVARDEVAEDGRLLDMVRQLRLEVLRVVGGSARWVRRR